MIATQRLILRRWREDDVAAYAAMMADPEVYYWLGGGTPTLAEAAAKLAQREAVFETLGFGIWAVERRSDGAFLGAVGLDPAEDDMPFHPGVEAAWRLVRAAWGQGYASEAAAAALEDGFTRGGLKEIFAVTAKSNVRSQAVMARLGMIYDPAADFDHPHLAPDHPLRPHVLYSLRRPA